MFKCGPRGKEERSSSHDISCKGDAMNLVWRLTTPNNEPKQHVRKTYKKIRMVIGMM